MMRPHRDFIATHLGDGAVMARKPPALLNIGIDRDRQVIDGFRCDYPVELHHDCAHRFLSDFDFAGDELVYSDPPYVRSARKAPHRFRFDYSDGDHGALLDILKGLPCSVMISGYPSRLYDAHLSDWRSLSLQVNNRSCVVTEKVWFNFTPDPVHWAAVAGRNRGHRQLVKERAARWRRRYAAMPPGERLAVMTAIMAVEADP